jgi:arabinan endo-1,5-alpha-L-arabinosidase
MGAGALVFDGEDDRIVVDAFDVEGGTGITLAAWIKPNSVGGVQSRIISKAEGGGTPDHYWAMVLAGGGEDDLEFRLRTDSGAPSRVTTPDGQEIEAGVWTHLALTWDANDPNMRFYKNGEEINMAGKGGTAVGVGPEVKVGVGNQSVSAGADSMDRPFNGIMDDVAIWNRGLSPAEIAEMMTIGIPVAVEPGGKLATAWGVIKY